MTTKYWYNSPVVVIFLDKQEVNDNDLYPHRLEKGDIVQGELIGEATEAASRVRISTVNDREVYGNIELPLSRFDEFDINKAYTELFK